MRDSTFSALLIQAKTTKQETYTLSFAHVCTLLDKISPGWRDFESFTEIGFVVFASITK